MKNVEKIRLLLLDVDGVLTNGNILMSEGGHIYKSFNMQDGLGIKLIQKAGIAVGIITGCSSNVIDDRAKKLHIQHVYKGYFDKLPAFHDIKEKLQLTKEEICYVGDDLPDLPVIKAAGFGVAVNNAVKVVKEGADWVTQRQGGAGAVREVCDYLLMVQNSEAVCHQDPYGEY